MKSHELPPVLLHLGGKISQCLWTCCHLSSLSQAQIASQRRQQRSQFMQWRCSMHSSCHCDCSRPQGRKAWYCIGFFERILKSIRYLHAASCCLLSSTLESCGFQFQAAGAPTLATSDDVTDLDLDQSSTISADIPVTVMQELSSLHPQRLESLHTVRCVFLNGKRTWKDTAYAKVDW